MGIKPEV